jgi:PAS domain S-box-containing protein
LKKSEVLRENIEKNNEKHRLYLEAVLANAPDAIITMDSHHKIIMCNQVAEKLFKYSRHEMIGKDIDKLIAGADQFNEAKTYSKDLMNGKNISIREGIRYRKDGIPIELIIAGSPIFIENKLVGAVAVYTDITERKRMENEIEGYSKELEQKVEQLREVNKELSHYIYAISHDLHAPLRALNNYTRFLKEDCSNSLDNTGHEYISCIEENIEYMNELVSDLTEYSKIGKVKTKIEEVDFGKCLNSLISKLNLGKNIEIRATKKNIIIKVSRARLEQIFSNLLSNAIKFNRSKKPHITIDCKDTGDVWEFSVCDNGIGIDSKYFNKIFDVFQRLHTQEEYRGTGIGLAIVKRVVEGYGGNIRVKSAPGKGSIFMFTLPKKVKEIE